MRMVLAAMRRPRAQVFGGDEGAQSDAEEAEGAVSNAQGQRPPPPETPGRLQESLTNYPNRPTAQRGGG